MTGWRLVQVASGARGSEQLLVSVSGWFGQNMLLMEATVYRRVGDEQCEQDSILKGRNLRGPRGSHGRGLDAVDSALLKWIAVFTAARRLALSGHRCSQQS